MIKLGNPYFLGLLWIVPAVVVFYFWAFKKKQILIEKFVSSELKDRLLMGVSVRRQRLKALLMVMGCFFTIFALLQPRWGFHWEEVKRRGVDIIVALDVSKSMLAEDISPNRLERAKRKIIDFLRIVQGDRVGLIAFAGTAFLQCPLTLDHGAVQIFLDSVNTDLIPVPGTAINEAINLGIKAFEKSERNSRALILITDGEETTGSDLEAAKKANEQGIKIYTIGVGKEGGAPIPEGEGGGFKKDRQGNVIMTKLDEQGLQKIALDTGGSYVRSVSGDLDLEKIYEDLRKNTVERDLKSGRQKRFEERFQWPLLLGLLCFILEAVTSERKGAFPWTRKKQVSILLFALILATGGSRVSLAADAKKGERLYQQKKYNEALKELVDAEVENPGSLQLKYNTASAYYKLKQYPEAEKLLQTVATSADPKLSEKAYYNLGNATYQQGKLQESLSYFQKATELDPKDDDAKHNLEFVRKEIRRRVEENKNREQKQQQEQQNSSNSQNKDDKKPQDNKEAAKNEKQSSGGKDDKDKKKPEASPEPSKEAQGKKPDDSKEKGSGAPVAGKMSEDEAKQWLSTLKEADRSKFQKQKGQGERQYEVEKDW